MKRFSWLVLGLIPLIPFSAPAAEATKPTIIIGSKSFTENVILGEAAAQLVEAAGFEVEHRRALGATRFLWNGLQAGDIHVYADYTGTIIHEILQNPDLVNHGKLRAALKKEKVWISRSLGFNNTYAVGLPRARADKEGWTKTSDLGAAETLRFGFPNEFMQRADGWPGMSRAYGMQPAFVRGMEHDLTYRGVDSGDIDATVVYTTDAEIPYYNLKVLEDDLGYFPTYEAVWVVHQSIARKYPALVEALRSLEGAISEETMQKLNARAKLQHVDEALVAADFLRSHLGLDVDPDVESTGAALWRWTLEHLYLVMVSLIAAIIVAIPVGVAAFLWPRFGQGLLALVGLVQTVPSLAMLVFMIPLLGIGAMPAIVALFLYSLLPIVRNTYQGLHDIAHSVRESAEVMGFGTWDRLRLIELPIASSAILAGVKTSAVINVGVATLGAIIGAGGYGQPILDGIRVDDTALILQGAVPAALLAVVMQVFFEWAERFVVPEGLRLARGARQV